MSSQQTTERNHNVDHKMRKRISRTNRRNTPSNSSLGTSDSLLLATNNRNLTASLDGFNTGTVKVFQAQNLETKIATQKTDATTKNKMRPANQKARNTLHTPRYSRTNVDFAR